MKKVMIAVFGMAMAFGASAATLTVESPDLKNDLAVVTLEDVALTPQVNIDIEDSIYRDDHFLVVGVDYANKGLTAGVELVAETNDLTLDVGYEGKTGKVYAEHYTADGSTLVGAEVNVTPAKVTVTGEYLLDHGTALIAASKSFGALSVSAEYGFGPVDYLETSVSYNVGAVTFGATHTDLQGFDNELELSADVVLGDFVISPAYLTEAEVASLAVAYNF